MYPQIFGKYVLEGEIARGGMARLVLATLRGAGGFEKKLVVKQIRDELASDEAFIKRFVDEAKTTVALSHPNIVPVYELGVEQGTYFLAMELVEGVSIAELLDGPTLSPEEGAYVGVEVCRALDYAHRRMKVVHGDITPRNVMVDEEGQVRLIDFGIARPVGGQSGKHAVFGSPGHMPPEQMNGEPVGPPADLFALGALLMEAWSKKAPFRRKQMEDVEAALAGPRTKPSEIDPRLLPLDEIMLKALASDAAERPQEAEELGRALRKFLTGVDLGDLARALGARVRERRAALREKKGAVPSSANGGLQRPASRGEMVTKTFAARPEALSVSNEVGPIATRKIATSSRPPPPDPSGIETPAKEIEPKRSNNLRALAALALVAAAIGGAYWLRGKPSPATDAPTSTPTHAPTPSPSPSPSHTLAPTASTTAAPTAPATASTADTKPAGHLALYGDPGTRAVVDGVSKGKCPLTIPIEPGEHEVRFVFDPTGDASGTRLTVKSGERVKVVADFTGATPTVRVQR